jgi:hypothetical protein
MREQPTTIILKYIFIIITIILITDALILLRAWIFGRNKKITIVFIITIDIIILIYAIVSYKDWHLWENIKVIVK